MFLSELNTFDSRLKTKNVYIVSLGATEQHGPFAPMGSDNYIQEALLKRVEEAVPDAVFLPHVPIGPSWQQLGFNGSLSLKESTLFAVITDIVDCLKDAAHTILFVSWHGGNKPVIRQFLAEKAQEYKGVIFEQITFGDEETDVEAERLLNGPPDDHAGNTEVALMLAVRPDVSTQPKLTDKKEVSQDFEWDRRIIEVKADGIIDEHPSWTATPEIGEALLDVYSTNLAKKIKPFLQSS